MKLMKEKNLQETFVWDRTQYNEYNTVLAGFQVKSCLENSRPGSLLDLACGDGTLTEIFSKHFSEVVGVDASGTHLDLAKQKLPNSEFHECLIEDFETNERFDTVLLLMILEHVNDPIALIKHAAKFLKNDGVLIIHVPNEEAINRDIAVKMGSLKELGELTPYDLEIVGHRRSYSIDSLNDDVKKAGLHLEKNGGIFYKMLSTAQMDWFLKNGLWDSGEFGWGRVGPNEEGKDWKKEFCEACYEIGKERPRDCNVIYACVKKNEL